MQLQDVIGQERHTHAFVQAYREGRLPHAQLLLAPEGAGDLPMAMAMGQYLQCEQPGEDVCGQCPSCVKASKMVHPDIHYTFPVIKPEGQKEPPISNDWIQAFRQAYQQQPYLNTHDWLQSFGGEKKTANITARECQTIIHQLNLKSYEGRAKVQVIWRPEFLGNAGNILLKLIEEPPPNTYLILVAEEEERILGTILSRCQIVRMSSLPDTTIIGGLKRKVPDLSDEAATRIAYQSDGNFNAALKATDQVDDTFARVMSEWLRICFKMDLEALLPWIDQVTGWVREEQKQFFQYTERYFRECLRLSVQPTYRLRVNEEQWKGAQYLAQHVHWESMEQMVQLLERQHYYVTRNANMKIQLLHATMELMALLQNQQPVGQPQVSI